MTKQEAMMPHPLGVEAEAKRKKSEANCLHRLDALCQTVKQMNTTIQANYQTQLLDLAKLRASLLGNGNGRT